MKRSHLVFHSLALIALAAIVADSAWAAEPGRGPRFTVTYGAALGPGPFDGRLLLMISKDPSAEPRFQISDTSLNTQQVFGIDVDGWKAGAEAVIDAQVLGFPVESLRDIPAGTYSVQALLHKYETFHRADGHVVKLPMDRGEGQQWSRAPGNLYSKPVQVAFDPKRVAPIQIVLDQVIPPIPPPQDTKYVRHERIRSELLSKFWGRDMYLGAVLLLPWGFDEHQEARYPLVINHGHFPHTITGFREEPPDPNLKPDYSERFHWTGYNRTQQEQAYQLYQDWTAPGFPRVLVMEIQHANPFYDDSYAVNSQNLGPYGDAIVKELIPYIEKKYRGLGQGWARFMYGGSTGGWEAMAAQIFYPDDFNGSYAACPDPIDFRHFVTVNIYEDENAFYPKTPWRRVARPAFRNYLGHLSATVEDDNRMELVIGTRTRSGQQWDIWEAVYSPVGRDGYPQRIFDKRTGAHRQEGRGVLAGELRPHLHPEARLGARTGAEARGQDQHLRGRHGQLLPEQRGLRGREVPEVHDQPALRRAGRLRRSGRALLERRPHAAQRDLAPTLPPDVHSANRGAHPEDGPSRGRRQKLEVLMVASRWVS